MFDVYCDCILKMILYYNFYNYVVVVIGARPGGGGGGLVTYTHAHTAAKLLHVGVYVFT